MEAAKQLAQIVGVKEACEALNVPRSSYYYEPKQSPPQSVLERTSSRAYTPEERDDILGMLVSHRFMDLPPRAVYARLLDEGKYYCSVSTMYRILRENKLVRERRNQRRHPTYVKPRLVATRSNQVWTWDVTRLPGPTPGTTYALYVILDLYSRYVVAWAIAPTESAAYAEQFLQDAIREHGIEPEQLILHSDRGAAMTSMKVSQLLGKLGVIKSFSRPRTSNDNPYSESQFKTMKYRPGFPKRFGSIEDAIEICREFFRWYNNEHYHTGLALLTPHQVHHGRTEEVIKQRNQVLAEAYARNPQRFVRKPPTAAEPADEVWINNPAKEAIEINP